MNRTDLIPATIIAACVLHNICLSLTDNNIQEGLQVDHDEQVAHEEGNINFQDSQAVSTDEGHQRRNMLAQQF